MPNLPNIFRQTTVPTVASSRSRSFAPGAPDPVPDPATGDLWIDMSQTPPVLKVLDGTLSGVTISTPPGTPTGTLQFNNGGVFGGVANSVVSATGGVTLAQSANSPVLTINPAGTTTTALVINNVNSSVIGMSLQRGSGGADLFRLLDAAGGTVLSMNADGTSAVPILKVAVEATVDKQALQLRRANAAAVSDLFQIYESTDASSMFSVNPGAPSTTGSVRISAVNVGMIISLTGAGSPLTCQINSGTALFDTGGANYIDLGGGSGPGARVYSAVGNITITCPGNVRTFDFLHSTGPRTGVRCTTANVFGTNDELVTPLSDTTGWCIFENFFGVTNQGVALSTTTTIPISIRPNRVETGQFPSGGGLILFQAAPTVGASQVGYGATTATTANTGANGAVPAQVAGYLIVNIAGTARKIPFYVT